MSYCSHFMTLESDEHEAAQVPEEGRVMTLGIQGLGEQRQLIVPYKAC